MSEIDAQLNELLKKFNLLPNRKRVNEIEKRVFQLWDESINEGPVLIFGTKVHCQAFINTIYENHINVVGIALDEDLYNGSSICGIKINDFDSYDWDNIAIVFISAYRERFDLIERVKNKKSSIKIVDPYEIIDGDKRFKDIVGHPYYLCKDYRDVYALRNEYLATENAADLRELIAHYLDLRDFVYAFKFIDIYIGKEYVDYKGLKKFYEELEVIFERIKFDARTYIGEDINYFIIDAIRASDIYSDYNGRSQMPFMKSLASNAIRFDNAYSASLDTLKSVYSFFTGLLPLDDNFYEKREVKVKESKLLSELHDNGYELNHYVGWKSFFENDSKVNKYECKSIIDEEPFLARSLTPRLLWNYLCNILDKQSMKKFNLIHLFYETHEPHICGYHEERMIFHRFYEYIGENVDFSQDEYMSQYSECLRYVDKQLEFYWNFFPKNSVYAFFGDHGQPAEKILGEKDDLGAYMSYHDSRVHIPLIIYEENLKPVVVDGFFNLKDLSEYIRRIMNREETNSLVQDFVEYQYDPYYFYRIIEAFEKVGMENYLRGFKVVRTEEYKYVIFDDGKEFLFKLPDEQIDLTNSSVFLNQLMMMRSKLNTTSFPSFDTNHKYDLNRKVVNKKQWR